MTTLTILALTISLVAPGGEQSRVDALRSAITAAVSERIGPVRAIEVEIVGGSIIPARAVSAQPAPGSRLGQPMRFLVQPATGRPFPVVAKVSVTAGHAVAAGEVLNGIVLARPLAVRAGDEVALTFRNGVMEVSGVARAVSSGSVGDVIRVTTPGSRDIRRARIIAPASVEIVR